MKPRLLDLFCGAGGCTKGYQNAGFYVVGVDVSSQPNYCGDEFVQMDALEFVDGLFHWRQLRRRHELSDFAAIHASPPCQHYANVTRWKGNQADHADLIGPTRDLLEASGLPYVIENVRTTALRADFMLCGTAFGLPIRRHRYFETNWSGLVMSHGCQHRPSDFSFDHGGKQPESVYRDAMGCGWMTVRESREAIPPAYTEFIGKQLVAHIGLEAAA
jgi:hypothetical protein